MEKYSRFNDEKSGVNPFTVQPFRPTVAVVARTALLLLLKAPFFLVAALLLALSQALVAVTPVAPVARIIRLTLERPASRLLLALFGFFAIEERTVSKTQVRVRPSKSNPAADIRSGDVVIANRCSYIDVLYFSATLAPVFTATTAAGGLVELSLFRALAAAASPAPPLVVPSLRDAATGGDAATAATARVLRAALAARRGPLLVFPEGAPTNNRAVLTFTPVCDQLAAEVVTIARGAGADGRLHVPTTHIVALKYGGGGGGVTSPALTAGSGWLHAALLAGQTSNALTVTRLPPGLEPQPADFVGGSDGAPPSAAGAPASSAGGAPASSAGGGGAASGSAPPAADGTAPATWSAATRDALVQLVRGCTAVALGVTDYAAFLRTANEQAAAAAGSASAAAAAAGRRR